LSALDDREESDRWLAFALDDLQSAQVLFDDGSVAPRQSCWLAQQAAEKALKAVLVESGLSFPKTHDLERLVSLIGHDRLQVKDPSDFAELSAWSSEARYPGDWPDPTRVDAHRAITLAERCIASATQAIRRIRAAGEKDAAG